ncbi:peptidoglycan-binding protein [Streptomyces sp. H27-D2]|uniref:peptidoglycan-binding protein n=1 Tax=Streptomyces sp. H27-D2 TaxID=3046304 RepID=UPI002DBF6B62|nr:peptidoglycan-binding protein [Streptomyces sp. H27-D2]MEC4016220.1 peptidoglycan-binding protein [Streptomyces sp. H27-D2]
MTAQRCPECGTQRDADGNAGCECPIPTTAASGAGGAAERAEAIAAAEDFDPLRIRPYVTLPEYPAAEPTAGPEPGTEPGPGQGQRPGPGAEAPTAAMPALPATGLPPSAATPLAGTADSPRPADIGLFGDVPPPLGGTYEDYGDDGEDGEAEGDGAADDPALRRRGRLRRKSVMALAVAAVVAAVVGAGVLVVELLPASEHGPRALPDERASVPRAAPSTESEASAPGVVQPLGSPTAAPSGPASPSAAATSAEPSPSATPTPSASPSDSASGRPTGTASGDPDDGAESGAATLSEGANGPAVTDLQRRLNQEQLYTGEEDGVFDAEVREAVHRYQFSFNVRGDRTGDYGPNTRRSLESRTDGS